MTLAPQRPAVSRWAIILASAAVVLGTLAAYHNSFSGPFIFDDEDAIINNPTIRQLWPFWQVLIPPNVGSAVPVAGRPVVNFTLAVNYAYGGLAVQGYHVLNLAIHIFAGLALLGVARRTFCQPLLRQRYGDAAWWLALAVAGLWLLHPLQTESVTYINQRAESLMGFFYLLTLYLFIRGSQAQRSGGWYALAVATCFLGMASKEVMVSAPLMVLLYDRTYVGGSFREAWEKRWRLYAGLAASWLLLGGLIASTHGRGGTVGFGTKLEWWSYALTQSCAIVHYLRLSLWPSPLVFDYGTTMVTRIGEIVPCAVIVISLLVGTAFAVKRWPMFGLVGCWFFAILAPSSSVVPLATQTMAEHRMYLALVPVVVLGVVGLHRWFGGLSAVIFIALAMGLGWATVCRNDDYRSSLAMWSDTAAKQPRNARALNNLGGVLSSIPGRMPEALAAYQAALKISPSYPEAHSNLGVALASIPGRMPEALAEYAAALRIRPDYAEAHYNLGLALAGMPDRLPEALAEYAAALRIRPDYAEAHNSLGVALAGIPGRLPEAMAEYRAALRINPDYTEAHTNLGAALASLPGRLPEALAEYTTALRIKPDYADAHYNLGLALARMPGRLSEALAAYRAALRIKPDYAEAHGNMGVALARVPGRLPEAMAEYRAALRINPNYAEAHCNMGVALASLPGRLPEALAEYASALRIKPDFAEVHFNLGLALSGVPGRRAEAMAEYEAALRIKPDWEIARQRLAQLRAIQL